MRSRSDVPFRVGRKFSNSNDIPGLVLRDSIAIGIVKNVQLISSFVSCRHDRVFPSIAFVMAGEENQEPFHNSCHVGLTNQAEPRRDSGAGPEKPQGTTRRQSRRWLQRMVRPINPDMLFRMILKNEGVPCDGGLSCGVPSGRSQKFYENYLSKPTAHRHEVSATLPSMFRRQDIEPLRACKARTNQGCGSIIIYYPKTPARWFPARSEHESLLMICVYHSFKEGDVIGLTTQAQRRAKRNHE